MAGNAKQSTDSRTIAVARYVSRHFDFEAYGDTKAGARRALDLGLKLHANQYKITDDDWYCADDIDVREITLGNAYRDKEKI